MQGVVQSCVTCGVRYAMCQSTWKSFRDASEMCWKSTEFDMQGHTLTAKLQPHPHPGLLLCMPSRHHPHTMHGLSTLIHLVHFPLSVNSNIHSRSSYNLNLIQVCAFTCAKWALSSQSHMQIRCSHLSYVDSLFKKFLST